MYQRSGVDRSFGWWGMSVVRSVRDTIVNCYPY